MEKIWEQQPQEPGKKYGFFKLFLEFESTSLKDFADSISGSYSQIKKYSATFKWMERRAAYQAFKENDGIADSATTITEDLVTAALVLGHIINPARAEVAENDTSESFNPASESATFEDTGIAPLETADLTVAETAAPLVKSLEEIATAAKNEIAQSQYHYQQAFIHYLKAGNYLIEARERLKENFGAFGKWLQENFQFSRQTANSYIRLAEWCSELTQEQLLLFTSKLNPTQALALTVLTQNDAVKFIEEKAVEEMTVKQTEKAVAEYKAKNENLQAENEKLQAENEKLKADNEKAVEDLVAAQNLADKAKQAAIKFGEKFTADMRLEKEHAASLKERVDKAREDLADANEIISRKNEEIQELKNNPVVVEITPPDYESNKRRIEELQAQINSADKEKIRRAEVFQALNTISTLLANFDDSALKFIEDYAGEFPDKFSFMCKIFSK